MDRTTPRDAVEYAAGRGLPERPVLRRDFPPYRHMPCADFSPWISSRLTENDKPAIREFIRQRYGMVEKEQLRPIDAPLRGLIGLTDEAERTLRTALLLSDDYTYIAAAMAPFDVTLVDPEATSARFELKIMNPYLNTFNTDPSTDPDFRPSPADVVPTTSPVKDRAVLAAPLGVRSHLVDLGVRDRTGRPGPPHVFAEHNPTRLTGYDREEGFRTLVDLGVLRVLDDPAESRPHAAEHLTVAQLREMLHDSGVSAPTHGRKQQFVDLAVQHCGAQLDAAHDVSPIYALSSAGEQIIAEFRQRVTDTFAMWATWVDHGRWYERSTATETPQPQAAHPTMLKVDDHPHIVSAVRRARSEQIAEGDAYGMGVMLPARNGIEPFVQWTITPSGGLLLAQDLEVQPAGLPGAIAELESRGFQQNGWGFYEAPERSVSWASEDDAVAYLVELLRLIGADDDTALTVYP